MTQTNVRRANIELETRDHDQSDNPPQDNFWGRQDDDQGQPPDQQRRRTDSNEDLYDNPDDNPEDRRPRNPRGPGVPGDDDPQDPPDQGPGDPDPDDPDDINIPAALISLAKAINAPGRTDTRSKVREPDPFDGSDSRKLQTFLVQCYLCFKDRPAAFKDNETKVNFALSYLKGTAFEWFEPGILKSNSIIYPWISDWDDFVEELQTNFGPYDPKGDAEADLENLTMRDGQRIIKYTTEFNKLAAKVDWGESALNRRFYKGLPARLKDEISRAGKPARLSQTRLLAQKIDSRHWERETEIQRERKASGKTSNQPSTSSSNQTYKSDKKPAQSAPTTSNKGSSSSSFTPRSNNNNNNASASSSGQKKAPDLSTKLGKDGKLTPEERQRRFNLNLCMFCGLFGHRASDCPKAAAAKKARAAKTAEPKPDKSDAPDSKK
jgi:hypothetical protein